MWATVIGGLCGNFSRDPVFFLSKTLIMVVAVNILTCRFFHVTLTIESYLISACLVIFFFSFSSGLLFYKSHSSWPCLEINFAKTTHLEKGPSMVA